MEGREEEKGSFPQCKETALTEGGQLGVLVHDALNEGMALAAAEQFSSERGRKLVNQSPRPMTRDGKKVYFIEYD